jgi:hypothetical protein
MTRHHKLQSQAFPLVSVFAAAQPYLWSRDAQVQHWSRVGSSHLKEGEQA